MSIWILYLYINILSGYSKYKMLLSTDNTHDYTNEQLKYHIVGTIPIYN